MTFTDLIDDFVQHLRLERGLSANTIAAYRADLSDFVSVTGAKTIEEVTPSTVTGYFSRLSQQGKRPATLARKISSIKRFFVFQQTAGRIKENPALAYAAPKISRYHPDYLSPEQIDSIITSIDPASASAVRDRAVVETLYGCGLRLSELINMQQSNIEFEAGFVRVVGKGNKQRLVPLGRLAKEAILEYLDNRRLPKNSPTPSVIFLNRFGKKFSRVGLWQLIRKLVVRAGISSRVTPHTFRHSFATHLLEGGAELRVVQEMLGHADISTTEIYTQIDRDYIIAEHRKYHPRELAGPGKPEKRS
jgi:integrase/recombinase XerD